MVMFGSVSSVPLHRPAVGMALERGFPPAPAGDIARACRLAAQHRQNLRAIDLDVGGIEARRGQARAATGRKPRRGFRSACAASRGYCRARRKSSSRSALRSSRFGKALESRSPAPSSSSEATRLAVPALPAESWTAPPVKAKSTAISGTAGSCTSQASMPPGLTTRSIVVARAGCADAANSKTRHRDRATARRAEAEQQAGANHSRMALLGLQAFDEIAGHRMAAVEPGRGRLAARHRRSRRGYGRARRGPCRRSGRSPAPRRTSAPASPDCPAA